QFLDVFADRLEGPNLFGRVVNRRTRRGPARLLGPAGAPAAAATDGAPAGRRIWRIGWGRVGGRVAAIAAVTAAIPRAANRAVRSPAPYVASNWCRASSHFDLPYPPRR